MERDQVFKRLRDELEAAINRRNAASKAFEEVTSGIPSGIPHPDGVGRIQRASQDYSAAQERVMKALTSVNYFLLHGTLPENPLPKGESDGKP